MNIEIRHNPSYAVARCHLNQGESCSLQSGVMMAHSAGVQLNSSTGGGLLSGLKRSFLAGESFFVTTAQSTQLNDWIDITNVLPGDILPIAITPNRPFFVTAGCWMGNSEGVQTDTKWGNFHNFFGGEGGFGLCAHGEGLCILGVYGALDIMDLAPGETVIIDTGHVVAYDLNMRFQLRKAAQAGLIKSMMSGEGLVFEFQGPGRVYLQARNRSGLESFIRSVVPNK